MNKIVRLTSSSLALLVMLFGSSQAQDATFDLEADNPAVEAELDETEAELQEFFKDEPVVENEVVLDPDADTRTEAALLDRASREATEFNDIDDDDLSELEDPRALGEAPRLEKPGQTEKDFAVICPLGTDAQPDGTCLAGPDYEFED